MQPELEIWIAGNPSNRYQGMVRGWGQSPQGGGG